VRCEHPFHSHWLVINGANNAAVPLPRFEFFSDRQEYQSLWFLCVLPHTLVKAKTHNNHSYWLPKQAQKPIAFTHPLKNELLV